jgi:excisionase family DNA binding protein
MTVTNDEIIQAVFTATNEAKTHALKILQGRDSSPSCPPLSEEPPLLLGMTESAKLLGVSRATLWRMVKDGRLTKVEIYHNAFRLRRSDILALVQGRDGSPSRPHSSSPSMNDSSTINLTSPEVRNG